MTDPTHFHDFQAGWKEAHEHIAATIAERTNDEPV